MSLDRTTPHPGADRALPRLGARAATAATVLALTAGTLGAGSLAAGAANAAQTSPRVSAAAVPGTGLHTGAVEERRARTCQEAKQDLRKAKKSVKKARKAKHNRATKVSRAKKRVEKRKNRRDKLCATGGGTTTPGQVQDEVDESRDALGSLPLGQLGALLPAELTGQLDAATAQLQGLLGQLEAGIPGADAGELAEISRRCRRWTCPAWSRRSSPCWASSPVVGSRVPTRPRSAPSSPRCWAGCPAAPACRAPTWASSPAPSRRCRAPWAPSTPQPGPPACWRRPRALPTR